MLSLVVVKMLLSERFRYMCVLAVSKSVALKSYDIDFVLDGANSYVHRYVEVDYGRL